MSSESPDRRGGARALWISLAAVAVLLVAGWGLWRSRRPAMQTGGGSAQQRTLPKEEVLAYDKLGTDKALQRLIDERKAAAGVEQGLDLIARPDESIEIGGTVIPMREILDKIRMQHGKIVEDELVDGRPPVFSPHEQKLLDERAARETKRLEEIDALLDAGVAAEQEKPLRAERAKLERIRSVYEDYRKTVGALEAQQALLDNASPQQRTELGEQLEELRTRKRQLASILRAYYFPEAQSQAYGIYVVQPGDNIWNIHFRFLRSYFANRGITLSPLADEPDNRGFSTGVGKLLKFSENMVSIYNVREHRLEKDLNLLQPTSKIVVFNLAEVMSILGQIDDRQVSHIQFDGETLWIPADQ